MGRKPDNNNHKLTALSDYLKDKNHGDFAKAIKTSPAHLSNILSGARKASLPIVNRIIQETDLEIKLKDLRPDIYEEVMKYGNGLH